MNTMKYIIVKDYDLREHAIIFPDVGEAMTHKHVARVHRASDLRVVSAGFCTLSPVATWGRSETLDIDSRPNDADVLAKSLGVEPTQ